MGGFRAAIAGSFGSLPGFSGVHLRPFRSQWQPMMGSSSTPVALSPHSHSAAPAASTGNSRAGERAGFLLSSAGMGRIVIAVIVAGMLVGCAYKRGSYKLLVAFEGEQRTVGCLDVAIAAHSDPGATGPVASLTMANFCDGPVAVDVPAIQAFGRFGDGTSVPMLPFDPAGELRLLVLEGRRAGREFIEYQAADLGPEPGELCLDVSRLDRDAPAPAAVIVCIQSQTPRVALGGTR